MNDLGKYLKIVHEEQKKRGLETSILLHPMLRVVNDKLYACVVLLNENDNSLDVSSNIKPEYWVLIDLASDEIIEFNKTSEKDFVSEKLIEKNDKNKQLEISKYTVEKTLQYKNYLIEDIRNEKIPLQKKLSSILSEDIIIDGERVNVNDYLLSNLEEHIKTKIDELVELLVSSKYESIIFYYYNLYQQVVDNYLNNKVIDIDKIKLCIEIMDNYHDGVIGIANIFNIKLD